MHDKIQLFKLVVKTIARKHGLYTFMAKPKFGIAGSGMHCNISLFTKMATMPSLIQKIHVECNCRNCITSWVVWSATCHNFTAVTNQLSTHTNVWFQDMKHPFILLEAMQPFPLVRVKGITWYGNSLETIAFSRPNGQSLCSLGSLAWSRPSRYWNKIEAPAPIKKISMWWHRKNVEPLELQIYLLPFTMPWSLDWRWCMVKAALGEHIYQLP